MDIISIIEKKRLKKVLTKEEIDYFIQNYVNGTIKDYQASSLLMAICINGMNEEETLNLCDSMIHSGETVDLSYINGITVDKHSSGGVSDTTSLALIPILACAGIYSVKMSGAGLGFTGGTKDKLESFSGINLQLNDEEIKNVINKCGCLIMSQSKEIAPADKKLYELRDITGTIYSLPLIATSIMSKKIASGNDIIFLDVKNGKGAFMEELEDAKKLAKIMIDLGKHYNKQIAAVISDMNEPLGNGIGCYLEVLDAIEVLQGKESKLFNLVKFMAEKIFVLSGLYDEDSAKEKFDEIIKTNQGYERFLLMIKQQNGNIEDIEKMKSLKPTSIIYADKKGYIETIKPRELGFLVCDMGGGKKELTDTIDHSVGIKVLKHVGDMVDKNEPIAYIYNTTNKLSENEIIEKVNDAISISENEIKPYTLIKEYYKD